MKLTLHNGMNFFVMLGNLKALYYCIWTYYGLIKQLSQFV